jgi:hypothetical protein
VNNLSTCIYCGQNDQNVPLIQFQFHGEQYWICPTHLPILIHQPDQLAGKLTGLEQLLPSEGQA